MESQGGGLGGHPWGDSRPAPAFDQQAFMGAMSTAFTSFAKTSVAGEQGSSNNLQRFKTHYPPTFTGGGGGGGGGSDCGRPLVSADREDIGGFRDHL